MVVDKRVLDNLTAKAKESPRLRVAMDLRNTPEDNSQRMLNAMEPGTVMRPSKVDFDFFSDYF